MKETKASQCALYTEAMSRGVMEMLSQRAFIKHPSTTALTCSGNLTSAGFHTKRWLVACADLHTLPLLAKLTSLLVAGQT